MINMILVIIGPNEVDINSSRMLEIPFRIPITPPKNITGDIICNSKEVRFWTATPAPGIKNLIIWPEKT